MLSAMEFLSDLAVFTQCSRQKITARVDLRNAADGFMLARHTKIKHVCPGRKMSRSMNGVLI